jgi:hypothetical protein
MPPKKKAVAQRVLVDGLTKEQDELLRTVQYRQGNLSGRDSLYLSDEHVVGALRRLKLGLVAHARPGFQTKTAATAGCNFVNFYNCSRRKLAPFRC